MSLDAQRLMDLIPYLHMVWSAFVQIGISTILLWRIVGWATIGGVALMVLLIPFNSWLARIQGNIQKEMMKCKDKRTKITNEVLQGIRVIKFFAWEESFQKKIHSIRATELKTLKKSAYLKAFTTFLLTSTPLFVSIVTFATYSFLGNKVFFTNHPHIKIYTWDTSLTSPLHPSLSLSAYCRDRIHRSRLILPTSPPPPGRD